jgi:hypothetical protein
MPLASAATARAMSSALVPKWRVQATAGVPNDGATVGGAVGGSVGALVGPAVGADVGPSVGAAAELDGLPDGAEGRPEATPEGLAVGEPVWGATLGVGVDEPPHAASSVIAREVEIQGLAWGVPFKAPLQLMAVRRSGARNWDEQGDSQAHPRRDSALGAGKPRGPARRFSRTRTCLRR